jgi:segregation and condensation protein B
VSTVEGHEPEDVHDEPVAEVGSADASARVHEGASGAAEGETAGDETAGDETAGDETAGDETAGDEAALAGHGGLDGDQPPLPTVLEAILLVTDMPVPAITLAQVVERPTGEVEAVLAELARGYDEQGRGFELRQVAGGWRLYTRAECAPFVERFVLDGQQARLTQAALETLAVIAYRQPVTRQRVSAVRGVNVDGVVRTLVARGLITEAGTDEDTGATRYQTTSYFLERLGLQSLDDLPSLAPLLPELEDLTDDSVSS